MTKLPSNTYCVLPWIHQAYKLDGYFRPCGRFESTEFISASQTDIKENFFSDNMNEIRKQMLDGEWPDGCIKCKNHEANNISTDVESTMSLRQRSNEQHPEYIGAEPKLIDLEICLSSDCNMACVMCCRSASTTWSKLDTKILKQTDDPHIKHEMEYYISTYPDRTEYKIPLDVDFWKDIKSFKLLGGEPFIVKYNKELIQFLYDTNIIQQITIKIVTNGSIKPDPKLWQQLNSCKKLKLVVSIDGIGSAAEWLRFGVSWSTIENNIKFFSSNVDKLGFHSCVTSLNIKHMEKVAEYLNNLQNNSSAKFLIGHNHVLDPKYISILYLDDRFKEKALNFIFNEQFEKILLSSMKKYENLTPSLINYIKVLDKTRMTDYKDMVPDNYQFLKDIGVFND